LLALMLVFIMVGIASYASIRDLATTVNPHITYLEISEIILNDVFTLIILAELIRFITALRASPGSRVIGLAEVGLIVSIREVVIASLTKEYQGLLLASTASLLLAIMIWLVKVKIMRG
ncbi:MAG: phosphate-starvation-inducible PsiE family protein, partial [Sulfolobales archaeon]